MPRTAVLGVLAASVLAWSWLRLERAPELRDVLLWTVLVGVVPALPQSRRLRIAAVALAVPIALREALGTASPRAAAERFGDGFVAYYDIGLPFEPLQQPLMHSLVELAVFGFALAVSLAVGARRPLLAAGLLVAGAGWPATLVEGDNGLVRGAVILASALAIVAGVGATLRPRQAVLAGAAVVAASVAIAGIPAVAKGAFLAWEDWDPYAGDDTPVSVGYVWETSYNPLTWPKRKTVVLRIEAPPVSRYWRATTLDVFNGGVWLDRSVDTSFDPFVDPLLPDAANDQENLVSARVKVAALQDLHLIGASVPVSYETDFDQVLYVDTGTAIVLDRGGIPRDSTYVTNSYVPAPSPGRLARSQPIYPRRLDRYLVVETRTETPPSPAFAKAGRAAEMRTLFAQNPRTRPYRVLYERARSVVGATTSPYIAAVRLENYFRRGSNYRYEESPPRPRGGVEPLVDFVTRTHAGYCQHFASTMALMLRYLGIPARVAAGFTSGRYDHDDGEWVVVDRDAHTWVEVWFRGIGWLPFDPTPGRGTLDGAYSSASAGFSLQAVETALAAGEGAADFNLDRGLDRAGDTPGLGRDVPGDVGATDEDQGSLLRLLLLVAVAAATGVSLFKVVLRRARFLTRDPRRLAGACRRELADFLTDQRLSVPESATLAELGEIVRHEIGLNAEAFVAAVEAARYGPPEQAPSSARQARRELRRLRREIRRRLSAWDRARGVVSLRSLGLT